MFNVRESLIQTRFFILSLSMESPQFLILPRYACLDLGEGDVYSDTRHVRLQVIGGQKVLPSRQLEARQLK